MTAIIDGVAEFAILLQHHSLNRRDNQTLIHLKLRVINGSLIASQGGLSDGDCIFRGVEIVPGNDATRIQLALSRCLGEPQADIRLSQLAICDRLPELRLIIPVINSRQKLSLPDFLALFDRFFNDLTQNLGADGDVLVPGDNIARARLRSPGFLA